MLIGLSNGNGNTYIIIRLYSHTPESVASAVLGGFVEQIRFTDALESLANSLQLSESMITMQTSRLSHGAEGHTLLTICRQARRFAQ